MNTSHNKIDYIEFPAKDLAAVKSFYTSVFGWEFTDYGPSYTSFSDGRLTGGFDTSITASQGSILVILYSEKLEETKEKVITAGGKITKDIFSFPGGRRFHFIDPTGNELAVWSE